MSDTAVADDAQRENNWTPEDQGLGQARVNADSPTNGAASSTQPPDEHSGQDPEKNAVDFQLGSSVGEPQTIASGSKVDPAYREKQLKVLIGVSLCLSLVPPCVKWYEKKGNGLRRLFLVYVRFP